MDKSYIFSYVDTTLFKGNVYDKIGFKEIHHTKPNYFWVINRKRQQHLKKHIKVDNSKDKTEIIQELNYYKIYNCGQVRYEYYKNKKT